MKICWRGNIEDRTGVVNIVWSDGSKIDIPLNSFDEFKNLSDGIDLEVQLAKDRTVDSLKRLIVSSIDGYQK